MITSKNKRDITEAKEFQIKDEYSESPEKRMKEK